MREWRARPENIERVRAQAVARYHRLREEVLTLLGPQCRQCGYSDTRALEIDHVAPVRHRSTYAKEWPREIKNIRSNPHEYQVLCANCHTIKSKGER